MRGRGKSGRRTGRNGKVQMTREVVPYDGARGEKVERMIVAVKESQGQCRIVVRGINGYNTATTASVGIISFETYGSQSEFASLAAEFRTFKVAGVKFDCYDQMPGTNFSQAVFGTFHTSDVPSDQPTTFNQAVDLSDSEEIAPGTGKVTKYWYPTGPLENSWFSTTANNTDYGGLCIGLPVASSSISRYSVIWAAVIDFRSRI